MLLSQRKVIDLQQDKMKAHWIIITACSERWGAVRLHLICGHASSIIWFADYSRQRALAMKCGVKKKVWCGYMKAWDTRQGQFISQLCYIIHFLWHCSVLGRVAACISTEHNVKLFSHHYNWQLYVKLIQKWLVGWSLFFRAWLITNVWNMPKMPYSWVNLAFSIHTVGIKEISDAFIHIASKCVKRYGDNYWHRFIPKHELITDICSADIFCILNPQSYLKWMLNWFK